jgi:glyoxylase-like metal-dependent hydrolase (beta-lactamase superfamily II)
MRIAPGLHRLGEGLVNAYLIEDGGLVTIVDAGVPGYWGDLGKELAAMGRSIDDVRALVLTHGHSDHIGFAERFRRERGIVPRIHELDAALARGEVPNPAKGLGPVKIGPLLSFLVFGARKGALRITTLGEVAGFGDGATLDVPGSLRVVHVPGHTPGSVALHAAEHGALFAGDALATKAVTTGAEGPGLAPFTADPDEALRSLERIEIIDAAWVLPGHGQPWTGGVPEAVRLVRERAAATTVAN